MNTSMMDDIKEFHKKFGLEYEGKPRDLPDDMGVFRHSFMEEELREYEIGSTDTFYAIEKKEEPELITQGLEQQLDALVDLVYVALGTAYLHGFNFEEAWRRVHAANMKKVRAASADESKRGSTFDVIKPPGWVPPSHRDLVEDNIHAKPED